VCVCVCVFVRACTRVSELHIGEVDHTFLSIHTRPDPPTILPVVASLVSANGDIPVVAQLASAPDDEPLAPANLFRSTTPESLAYFTANTSNATAANHRNTLQNDAVIRTMASSRVSSVTARAFSKRSASEVPPAACPRSLARSAANSSTSPSPDQCACAHPNRK
jgi:hypothetical protein